MQSRSVKKWAPVVAMCLAVVAVQVLGAEPAAATSISVQVFPASYSPDRLAAKSLSAPCPPGQRVLGGGALTVGGVHAIITELQPIHAAGGDSLRVSVAADQFGISVAWGFQVFPFCAAVPAALNVQIETHTNQPTSTENDQAVSHCKLGTVIGVGGKIDNGNGQVNLSFFTNSSGDFPTGSAASAQEDDDGFAGTYTVTSYSVCAQPTVFGDFQQFKIWFVTNGSSVTSTPNDPTCPSGMHLTGLAGGTETPGTHLQIIEPNRTVAPNAAHFVSQSSVGPIGNSWIEEATIFCAK
jgi:hypothetical protein